MKTREIRDLNLAAYLTSHEIPLHGLNKCQGFYLFNFSDSTKARELERAFWEDEFLQRFIASQRQMKTRLYAEKGGNGNGNSNN